MKYYTSVWCVNQKTKTLFLLRPQTGEIWSGSASVGEESSRSAEKHPWKQAYCKCWWSNLACNYSWADMWHIRLMGAKSVSISSPGDSSSYAGGAEAEIPSCCPGEVCFHREWQQGTKSATAHGPVPQWLWNNPSQLAKVRSEIPQLCTGNGRDASNAVPARGDTCRRKSGTERPGMENMSSKKTSWKTTSNTHTSWGLHRLTPESARGFKAHLSAWPESAQKPFSLNCKN